jgi:lipopolysaccharide export system protein LptA
MNQPVKYKWNRRKSWLLNLLLIPAFAFSQEPALIRLIQADEIRYDKRAQMNVQVLSGHIILEHDSAYLYCDSAYLNEVENRVEAFGNVHVESKDTLHLYGRHMIYDGNTKVGEIHEDVKLVDGQTTLLTEDLIYDRIGQVSQYYRGGRINTQEKELTSDTGYYYNRQKEFVFNGNVVLIDPDYTLRSEWLRYNTESEIAYFQGPTHINAEDSYIYCETGWFDTRNDIAQLGKNSWIRTGDQTMRGDSLYYDQGLGLGKAFRNVILTDTVQDIILKGHYSIYNKELGFSMITDSAVAILAGESDSLFLHADTLIAYFDTAQKAKDLYAYHRAKFYRKDIQGMCDSLYYNLADSLITLYREPVLWSEENQLTADSIRIWFLNKQIDKMMLHHASLIISKDDTIRYNQIRGLNMTGYFRDNKLERINVEAASETIYYIREEDETLIGVNKAASGSMWIFVKDNKIERIQYIGTPSATLYPERDLPIGEEKLKGFKWLGDRRPLNKDQIFNW